jgi:ABC-type bacteriocin/lantibiotic exporter with double-glycine peptidase domain
MKTASLKTINRLLLDLYKIPEEKREYINYQDSIFDREEVSIQDFLSLLTESGGAVSLLYFRNWLNEKEIIKIVSDLYYPVLLFRKSGENIEPLILINENRQLTEYHVKGEAWSKNPTEVHSLLSSLLRENNFDTSSDSEKILVVTCFPNQSIFTEENRIAGDYADEKRLKTFERFLKIIHSEKREIIYIYVYAIIAGIIGLSLPLGIQSIIGFISSGQISTSVVVLISFVILGVLITGGMQVMQLSLVEIIQQRLFTKTAFEFAFRIPKIRIESVLNYYPPELMNRFFDIVTLQKGVAKILLEFSAALLQIIIGLILLSFYHSSFIFFGIFLVAILVIILRFTGVQGLKTSLRESKFKYMVANWLEEIARSLSTFKLAGHSNLPLEKTDHYVSNYLYARKKHFRVLVTQYISFVMFKTLITGGLLILGCVLMVEKKINIGQFVASEIIIILIMNAVEKIVIQLNTIYDVLTSIEKIGNVTDLPIEMPKGINIGALTSDKGLEIKIRNLKYKYPAEPSYILKGIDLDINPGERVCVTGYSSSGKTTFINIILGFLPSYEGVLTFNNVSLHDINKNTLITLIGDNISQEDLFDGSILENISLGRNNVKLEDVLWAINTVGLDQFVHTQKEGIQTRLIGGRLGISESVSRKIIIARSIVARPKLLILEDFLLGLEREKKMNLIRSLTGEEFKWTFIIISNDVEVMKICDRTIVMKEGTIVSNGKYEEIIQNIHLKDLI